MHFLKQDHRLDRWESVANITRTTSSASDLAPRCDTEHRTVTRAMRRANSQVDPHPHDDIAVSQPVDPKKNPTPPANTAKVRNVSNIVFGNYRIDTWYYSRIHVSDNNYDTLYVCPTCLALEINLLAYAYHLRECTFLRPPGRIIYDDAERDIRVYEIDAYINQLYCMRFARIAKFFIEHKVICYDICPFMFYVVTVRDEIAGYFSKERPILESDFNVSCILTFPQHQRKGVGSFLIALSYELSRREGKKGTPERPLSDLGRVSYARYWTTTVLQWLRVNQPDKVRVSIRDISTGTGITEADIITVLKDRNIYCVWKGEKCADICHKLIDKILARTPLPKIPLRARNFRNRWQTSAHLSDVPRSSLNSTPPFEPSKKAPEINSRKISIKYDKFKSHCNSTKTATPETVNGIHTVKGYPSSRGVKYSPIQEKKIIEFIEKHSPRTVLERLGSDEGISHEQLRDLAKSLGKGPISVRKKLLRCSLLLSGEVKLKKRRAHCFVDKYVMQKMANERYSESWTEEKLTESNSESSEVSSEGLAAGDSGADEDCCEPGEEHDVEQDDIQDDDQNGRDSEGDATPDDQTSNHSDEEGPGAGVNHDRAYSGPDYASPEPMHRFEEPEDVSYLDTDTVEEPGRRAHPTRDKKRVKFNEEVVVKGGVVVIDD